MRGGFRCSARVRELAPQLGRRHAPDHDVRWAVHSWLHTEPRSLLRAQPGRSRAPVQLFRAANAGASAGARTTGRTPCSPVAMRRVAASAAARGGPSSRGSAASARTLSAACAVVRSCRAARGWPGMRSAARARFPRLHRPRRNPRACTGRARARADARERLGQASCARFLACRSRVCAACRRRTLYVRHTVARIPRAKTLPQTLHADPPRPAAHRLQGGSCPARCRPPISSCWARRRGATWRRSKRH